MELPLKVLPRKINILLFIKTSILSDNANTVKIPDFRHIIAFIAEKNSFLSPEDIINNQVLKTGKSRGVVRPYVYTALNRLKKRGQVSSIKNLESGLTFWGLPGWTDFNEFPLESHKPLCSSIVEGPALFEVNPLGVTRRSFVQRRKV